MANLYQLVELTAASVKENTLNQVKNKGHQLINKQSQYVVEGG